MLSTDALPNEQSSLPTVIQLSKIMRSLHLLMISAFFFLGASESLGVSAIPAHPNSAVERRSTQPKVSPPPFHKDTRGNTSVFSHNALAYQWWERLCPHLCSLHQQQPPPPGPQHQPPAALADSLSVQATRNASTTLHT